MLSKTPLRAAKKTRVAARVAVWRETVGAPSVLAVRLICFALAVEIQDDPS